MLTLWTFGIIGILIQVEAQVQWGSRTPFPFTQPTQQPQLNRGQFQQPQPFFPVNNQQRTQWGAPQTGSEVPQQPWNFRRPGGMPSTPQTNIPGALPNSRPGSNNLPGQMTNNIPGSIPNTMPGGMPNTRMPGSPRVVPNSVYPGIPSFPQTSNGPGGLAGTCVPKFYQPNLCRMNGENKHKYTLQAVMNMLGDKNIEKVPYCIPGIQRVNCADYTAAQYIWKRGYCYCKRYHNNLHAFRGMAPLRCVLNNCGGCSQEFYLESSRIVDCD
uniref:Shell protein 19 n=1 Tax=Patelloida mimula TaxID=351188 RepID=A0A8U0AS99_9GAST|nr:shell protein 19 [Patelloida mimula]